MRPLPRRRTAVLVVAVLLAGPGCSNDMERRPAAEREPSTSSSAPARRVTSAAPTLRPAAPLAGRIVVVDPGHQLGNAAHPAETGALVDAGGFRKPCNTTGTATADGYPEATFTWLMAIALRRLLTGLGARVLLTRTSNSVQDWGPCVDDRGRAGNPDRPGPTADLKVSIHADGSLSVGAHGFHVIAPADVAPWTADIAGPSRRLAETVRDALVRAGVPVSTYAGHDGIDVRGDLGTLNLADVPSVLVELGNMRDPDDAARMTSVRGRGVYASALASAVERFLAR